MFDEPEHVRLCVTFLHTALAREESSSTSSSPQGGFEFAVLCNVRFAIAMDELNNDYKLKEIEL